MDFASIGINLEQSNLLTWGVVAIAAISWLLLYWRVKKHVVAFVKGTSKRSLQNIVISNVAIAALIVLVMIVGFNMRTQRKIKVKPDTTMERNLQDHVGMTPEEIRQHREHIRQKRADQWKNRKQEAREDEKAERERLRKQLMGK